MSAALFSRTTDSPSAHRPISFPPHTTRLTSTLNLHTLLNLPHLAYGSLLVPALVSGNLSDMTVLASLRRVLKNPVRVGEALLHTDVVERCAAVAKDEGGEVEWEVRKEALGVLSDMAAFPQVKHRILSHHIPHRLSPLLRSPVTDLRHAYLHLCLRLLTPPHSSSIRTFKRQLAPVLEQLDTSLESMDLAQQALVLSVLASARFVPPAIDKHSLHVQVLQTEEAKGFSPLWVGWSKFISNLDREVQTKAVEVMSEAWGEASYEARTEMLRCLLGATTTIPGRKRVLETGLLQAIMSDLEGSSFEFQGLILQVACNISQYPPAAAFLQQHHHEAIVSMLQGTRINNDLSRVAKRALEAVTWTP